VLEEEIRSLVRGEGEVQPRTKGGKPLLGGVKNRTGRRGERKQGDRRTEEWNDCHRGREKGEKSKKEGNDG